jgi:uncharacterized protein YbcI
VTLGGDTHRDGASNGQLSAAISNAVVSLTNQYTGRGPTKARTYVNRDAISVVLQDTLTRGELSLVAAGRSDHVRLTRRHYQSAMREDMVAEVERLSERKVIAFMSDNSIEPDFAIEAFVLESLPAD